MSPRRWEQLAAGSGVIFALLAVTGMLIGGGGAEQDAEVYFVESRGLVLVQAYLFGLGLIFFLLFLGALHHRLRLPEGEALSSALFAGGILMAGGLFLSGALNTALAAGIAERVDPLITRSLYAVSVRIVDLVPFWIAAFVGSAALLILRTRVLAPWIGWFGLAVAAGALLAPVAIFVEGGVLGSGGPYANLLFPAAFLAWIIISSVMLVRRV